VGFNFSGNMPLSVILATSNGGATWKAQDVSGAGSGVLPESVAFVDAMHGWAVGNGILATSDGGATWKVQDYPSSADGWALNLYSVTFVDAMHGWAVGARGVILATSDGGASWHAQSSGSDDEFRGVAFPNAAHGWAVGIKGGGWGAVIRATTPTVTLKLSGLRSGVLKRGKRVIAKGTVTPSSLAGSKVTLTLQRMGAKWVKLKAAAALISSTGAYSWRYKATKKGVYRVRVTTAKTTELASAKSAWCSFRVK